MPVWGIHHSIMAEVETCEVPLLSEGQEVINVFGWREVGDVIHTTVIAPHLCTCRQPIEIKVIGWQKWLGKSMSM